VIVRGLPNFPMIRAEVAGHKLTVSVTGADRLAAVLRIIETAKSCLRLFFYIFGDDEISVIVREALIDARNRGVEVSLLIDGFGNGDRSDSAYAPLIEAGVVFARFHSAWGRSYLLRNHQKMIVADDDRALVGGANIVSHYFADDPNGGSWHDIYVTIEGPSAARLAHYHDALKGWMLGSRKSLRTLTQILTDHSDTSGPIRWMMGGPFQRLSPLTRSIKRDLHGTRRLDMIQAYFSPNWGMLRRLARIALRKGGQVRMITAARSDNGVTIAAARHCYRRLLRGGVEILEYQPQMLHMKLIVADEITYIGSANFDMRSLYINAEIMVRIVDKRFANQIRELVAAHVPYCEAITPQVHSTRSGFFSRMKWLLAYFIVSSVDFTVSRGMNLRRDS
jgi:cardiolipin synthase A/B